MTDHTPDKHDQVLVQLVVNLQMLTMQHLGKLQSPVDGEITRDLDQARGTIDVLEMLKVKCRNDTPEEIVRMLDQVVMDLQLNYMDERKRGETADADEAPAAEEPAAEEAAAEEAAADKDEACDD